MSQCSGMVISVGLSSVNSSLSDIKTTSAALTNQQSELNATLTNISLNALTASDGCTAMPDCTELRDNLYKLHTGPAYSVRLDELLYCVRT